MKVNTMVWIRKNWLFLTSIIIGLAFFSFQNIADITLDFVNNIKIGSIFTRYSIDHNDIIKELLNKIDNIYHLLLISLKELNLKIILKKILRFIILDSIKIINYGINISLIIYLLYRLYLSRVVFKTKTTKLAKLVILFFRTLSKIIKQIKQLVKILIEKRRKIIISLIVIFLLQGFLFRIILETIIFVFYYIKTAIQFNTHLYLLDIIKASLIFSYLNIPIFIIIFLLIIGLFYYAVGLANRRLEKNYRSFKVIEKFELAFINIVFGPPGVGKTRLLVNLALACNENFINTLEHTLKEIEIEYPEINFSEIIQDPYQHIKQFPKHYYYYSLLHENKSFIASAPFGIVDPYADELSVRLDFDYIRPNKFGDVVPLEEFKVICLSELDKEYNSHYNTKDVGEDGTHLFFGTASHWMKRNGKVYIDYQQPTQVPLNIRGNAENFIRINKVKSKYPILLRLYRFPFVIMYKLLYRAIDSYENYQSRLAKRTRRRGKKTRKRYDYTFLYSIFKYSIYGINIIKKWFDNFNYIIFYVNLEDVESNVINKIKLKVNTQDELWNNERLYDSTFLSKGYDDKYKNSKKKWKDLDSWSSITPRSDELKAIHSRFINKAFFGFDEDKETNQTKKTNEGANKVDDSNLEELGF